MKGNAAIKKYDIIGAGRRQHVVCPLCGSTDRNRWVWYIIENYVNCNDKRILHFAPEKQIKNAVGNNNDKYYGCDVMPGKADYIVDITDISFNDNYFDLVICNHVLEHVKNEEKAIKELARVVVKGGKVIITVPYSLKLDHTIEDTSNNLTDRERQEQFGQKDHVRIHGKDFKEYIQSFGFEVTEYVVNETLSEGDIDRMALIRQDRVFVLENLND